MSHPHKSATPLRRAVQVGVTIRTDAAGRPVGAAIWRPTDPSAPAPAEEAAPCRAVALPGAPQPYDARRADNAARSRRILQDRVRALGSPWLLTLTTRAPVALATLWDAWRRFRRLAGLGAWVGVAELQQRGAWHLHIVTDRPAASVRDYARDQGAWRHCVRLATRGETDGVLDWTRSRMRGASHGAATAAYIAKYLGKALGDFDGVLEHGVKTFRSYGVRIIRRTWRIQVFVEWVAEETHAGATLRALRRVAEQVAVRFNVRPGGAWIDMEHMAIVMRPP